MKKLIALTLCMALAAAFALTGCAQPAQTTAAEPAAAAEEKTEETAPAAEELPTEAAAEEPDEIAVVVKVAGIDWFNTMEKGVRKAAEDFGVNAYLVGPSEADAALQVQMVEDLVTKGVDGIVCVPTDATALEPAFAKAKDKGIVIITNESPNQPGADFDYEMINVAALSHSIIDQIAEKSDSKGQYAMFVGGLTVPLHNLLADEAVAYQKATYPEMQEVTDRMPVAESIQDSYDATINLLKTYPDLAAVIGWGSQGPIGAAQAIRDENKAGAVVVTGLAMPGQAKDYLSDNSLTIGYLWNPEDAGYFGVYAALACIQGGIIENGKTFTVPGNGMEASVSDNIINFDGILTFTTETVDNYNF